MICLDELEDAAAEVLEPQALDYFRGGADAELTVAENAQAWRRIRLRPHVLRDVRVVDVTTTVLGDAVDLPVLVAPTAYHLLANAEGERGTARGAAAAGTLMVLSTLATQTLEDVAEAAPGAPRWFQLYVHNDRGWTTEVVERAKAAGYRALVLTVDVPVLGFRRRDERSGFGLPPHLGLAHRPPSAELSAAGAVPGSALAAFVSTFDAGLVLDDIAWLGDVSGLPVIAKGVLRGDDAAGAVAAGAAGVVVSNHGGRQLDTAVSTAYALPEVVDAVAGRAEVYVDGGIRAGTDVLKALALGARAVLVGRPVVYGLALRGAEGVTEVLETLGSELRRAMALCGAARLDDLSRDLLA